MSQPALTPADQLNWQFIADTVMGGVSSGTGKVSDGAVHLKGTVSTANNGGFIQVRTPVDGLPQTSLTLRVRGNGEVYFIHLRTRFTALPWQYYQGRFTATEDWTDVTLELSGFKASGRLLPARISPGSVRSIGLVAYGRDHQADVSLAALGPL